MPEVEVLIPPTEELMFIGGPLDGEIRGHKYPDFRSRVNPAWARMMRIDHPPILGDEELSQLRYMETLYRKETLTLVANGIRVVMQVWAWGELDRKQVKLLALSRILTNALVQASIDYHSVTFDSPERAYP